MDERNCIRPLPADVTHRPCHTRTRAQTACSPATFAGGSGTVLPALHASGNWCRSSPEPESSGILDLAGYPLCVDRLFDVNVYMHVIFDDYSKMLLPALAASVAGVYCPDEHSAPITGLLSHVLLSTATHSAHAQLGVPLLRTVSIALISGVSLCRSCYSLADSKSSTPAAFGPTTFCANLASSSRHASSCSGSISSVVPSLT